MPFSPGSWYEEYCSRQSCCGGKASKFAIRGDAKLADPSLLEDQVFRPVSNCRVTSIESICLVTAEDGLEADLGVLQEPLVRERGI